MKRPSSRKAPRKRRARTLKRSSSRARVRTAPKPLPRAGGVPVRKRKARQPSKKRVARPTARRRPGASKKKVAAPRLRRNSKRVEEAILAMNRGQSIGLAARGLSVPAKTLESHLRRRLLKRKGKRWVLKDERARRIPVMTGGRSRTVIVRGYAEARLIGEHHAAVGKFVRTNNLKAIRRFRGRRVRLANGRELVLETDPNELHRLASMDSPPFHEIYEITSPT